jgi:hypothetical protein
MNEELAAPGLDLIIPDITKACPMFFPWTAESAHRASQPENDDATVLRLHSSKEKWSVR